MHIMIDAQIIETARWAGLMAAGAAAPAARATVLRPRGRHSGTPRAASTYRGARRNAWHAARRRSHDLKAVRKSMGLSRRDFDRLRDLANRLDGRMQRGAA